MNNCCFTGYLVDNPRTSHVQNVLLAEFTMVVYTYRKTKSGEKSRMSTYIHCEAWHTGAEIIEKFASKGTKMTVQCSARHIENDEDFLVFRVNEFDICNNNEFEEWE